MSDVWDRLRAFADLYPDVEADLVSGPVVAPEPGDVTIVVVRDPGRPCTTDRLHVLHGSSRRDALSATSRTSRPIRATRKVKPRLHTDS